jgi:hypothetical protein
MLRFIEAVDSEMRSLRHVLVHIAIFDLAFKYQ